MMMMILLRIWNISHYKKLNLHKEQSIKFGLCSSFAIKVSCDLVEIFHTLSRVAASRQTSWLSCLCTSTFFLIHTHFTAPPKIPFSPTVLQEWDKLTLEPQFDMVELLNGRRTFKNKLVVWREFSPTKIQSKVGCEGVHSKEQVTTLKKYFLFLWW